MNGAKTDERNYYAEKLHCFNRSNYQRNSFNNQRHKESNGRGVKMGKKKLQGADGMNFQLQLTIKGLESINLPEENLTNESGNDIMKISCWGGKLSAYVNLPNAIPPLILITL